MFSRGITFFLIISLDIPKIVVSLHPEISPLQLKGYVDVVHSCRLYGIFVKSVSHRARAPFVSASDLQDVDTLQAPSRTRAPFVSASDLLRRSSFYFLSSGSAAANVWSLMIAYGL